MSAAITHILDSGGPVARALGPDYEPRQPQLRMTEAVAAAMEARETLLVEAGTGVGKSFAYLVPAIDRCLSRGETVVVATNTIALQEQLMERDIPLLQSTIAALDDESDGPLESPPPGAGSWAGDLRACLVKGRGNYVSIRRLKLASSRQDKLLSDPAARRSLHVIEDWAYDTSDGSLSTLPPLERMGVWDKVQSDSSNCMGRKCSHYDECFYQSSRRVMERSQLLICNHALFFSDLALRARGVGFLPKYDHVILDEAHGVEDVAAEHFGLSLSEGRVNHLLSTLFQSRSRRGYLANLQNLHNDGEAVGRAIELVARAERASRDFFESMVSLEQSSGVRNGRVHEPRAVANPLTPAMNDLAMRLRSLREDTKNEPDRFELAAYIERAVSIADVAEAWVEQTAEHCVYWIEVRRPGRDGEAGYAGVRVTIAASPIDVAPLLDKYLFSAEHSTVLTSATLATRTVRDDEPTEHAETAFAYTIGRLGCEGARTLQLGSPFEYARQVEVYVDRTMPAPSGGSRGGRAQQSRSSSPLFGHQPQSYEGALTERIVRHVRETGGGAFVLFTSFSTLYKVADMARVPLADEDLPLLVQGRDGSRTEILRQFRESDRAVLFGAASFWQGVDVRGRSLRNVIITRLPFEPPDRPLTEARIERIRDRGGDPFKEDSLPRAVIRFKQGFGRLIRSSSDTGRVVILDPRVLTTGYGKAFMNALPAGVRTEVIHS
ncbi:MAG: helicase [Planctomycetota bacterium]|nr:MAG: helicase [Planctomycetota bacterium]